MTLQLDSMRRFGLLVFLVCVIFSGTTQTKYKLKDHIQFNGYLKFMQTDLIENIDTLYTDNLFHNRLNLRVDFPKGFSFGGSLRTRIFWGDVTRAGIAVGNALNYSYADQLLEYDGVLNMEKTWVDGNSVIINSIIDRLWLNYSSGNWDIRVGRQRVNWGINTVWNPNDLFNALNYLDFDYEERQGSDAARVQYYLSNMSSIEFAYKWAKDPNDNVGAIKYKFNTHTYDVQFLAGKYQQDLALGLGWAGNIGQAGFKGEGTYFTPFDSIGSGVLSFTTSLEYGFKNGWFGMASYLLNTGGIDKPVSGLELKTTLPSAKELMPNKHTVFLNFSKPLSPVWSLSLGGFYGFGVNWAIFFPSITYSIKPNWDIDLVSQLFWGQNANQVWDQQSNAIFLRLKWSF